MKMASVRAVFRKFRIWGKPMPVFYRKTAFKTSWQITAKRSENWYFNMSTNTHLRSFKTPFPMTPIILQGYLVPVFTLLLHKYMIFKINLHMQVLQRWTSFHQYRLNILHMTQELWLFDVDVEPVIYFFVFYWESSCLYIFNSLICINRQN